MIVDWVEFIIPSAHWRLYDTPVLRTWSALFVAAPPEALPSGKISCIHGQYTVLILHTMYLTFADPDLQLPPVQGIPNHDSDAQSRSLRMFLAYCFNCTLDKLRLID